MNVEVEDWLFAVGTAVELRTHFDGRWTGGFGSAEVVDDGSLRYRVRRVADSVVLPVEFSPQDVAALRPWARRL